MIKARILHWRWFPFVGRPTDKTAPFWLVAHWGYWIVLFGKGMK